MLFQVHNNLIISQIYDFCLYSPACMIILFLARKVIIRIFIGEKMANFAPCRSKMREIIYKINY